MTNKTDAWMPLWIGAYLADTMRLTTTQHGAYLLLLMAYWREGAALPDDDDELRSIARADRSEWKKLRPVLEKFFRVADGVWWHKRVEAELQGAKERAQKASDRAKKGAKTRWGDGDDEPPKSTASMPQASQQASSRHINKQCLSTSASNAKGMLKPCPTPSPSPNTNKSSSLSSEPPGPGSGSDDDGFSENPQAGQPDSRGDPWADGLTPPDPVTWASVFGDAFGVPVSTSRPHEWAKFSPLAAAWCAAGVTVVQMRAAVTRAHAEAGEPIAYLPAYADRVLASMVPRQPRTLAVVPAVDPESRQAVEAQGVAMGIGPWDELREHWPQYRRRVRGSASLAGFAPSLAAIVAKGLTA